MTEREEIIVVTKDNISDFQDKFVVYAYFTKLDRPLYVGETRYLHNRECNHRSKAKNFNYRVGNDWCDYARAYWNKYGEMPVLKVLCVCKTRAEAQQKESEFRNLFEDEFFQLLNQRGCGSLKGSNHSNKTKIKMRQAKDSIKRKVLQYSKDTNEFLKEFPSVISASIQTGVNKSNLISALKGRLKSAGGYIWKYAEENL